MIKNDSHSKYIFRNSYSWVVSILFFFAACGAKWVLLAKQGYYIRLSDELPGAYHLASIYSLRELLIQVFGECNCTLDSVRPFFTAMLYIVTFKVFGFTAQAALILGVILGSFLVPLYYWIIRAVVNLEVAIFSSLILLSMSNYICQSLALTTILPGIIFIVGALLAANRFYGGRGRGYLYLSGFLLSMSVFCRYENTLFVPVFLGYCYLFDKKESQASKLLYGLLCAGSSLYILYCNYRLYGNFFHMMRLQSLVMHQTGMRPPVHLMEAYGLLWDMLSGLLQAWVWWAAAGGAILMTLRYRLRAMWFLGGMLFWTGALVYKLREGTLDINADYFLLLALVALPTGLECLRAFFVKIGSKKIYGAFALGIAAITMIYSFWGINLQKLDPRLKYPHHFVRLTEDLKRIPVTSALYVDSSLSQKECDFQSVLTYLKRDPQKYIYYFGRTNPLEKEYYFLTRDDQINRVHKKESVKMREYRGFGPKSFVLYRITQHSK